VRNALLGKKGEIMTENPTTQSRRSQLNDRRTEIIKVFAELGFVDLLVRSGLWQHAPAGLKAREAAHGQSEQPDQPAQLRRALERLGGAFVKLGQMLSVRSDLIPQQYVAELEKLQDEIEPMSFETVRAVLESELECSPEEVFATFAERPLGAASLAQVHAAELQDGTEVVVKVQRPEAPTLIDLDLELMARAAQKLAGTSWAGDFDLVGIVAEFGKALRSELDFTSEARNLDRFGDFFADDEGVKIPRVYWDYTSSRLLIESRLDGIPLSRPDVIRDSGGDVRLLVRRGVDAYLRMVFELRSFHSDPHPGNLLALPGDALGFLDFGRVSSLSERALDRSADYLIALAENDSARVTDVLLEITHAGPEVDVRELRFEIEEMMDRYARADIADTMGQSAMSETMSIARAHRLHMPTEYAMLFQTFAVLQGVVLKLDPQTKLLDVAEPYIRRGALEDLPERAGKEIALQFRRYGRLAGRIPDALESVLRRLSLGELGIKIKITDSDEVLDRTEAIANRFSLTLLLSAVAIALAMVVGQTVPGWVKESSYLLLLVVFVVAVWHFVSIVTAERRVRLRKRGARDSAPGPRGR
jgi:ubiquinone biosynthesis protein